MLFYVPYFEEGTFHQLKVGVGETTSSVRVAMALCRKRPLGT